jgi:predicted RNase H-like HicB family nuclease
VNEALAQATYEYGADTESWCAWVEALPGCWSQADTVEEARREMAEVIEGWLILSLQRGHPIPELNGRTVGYALRGERVAAIAG